MEERINQFGLEKPRWSWRGSGWWFTIWGVIAALIVLLFPTIVDSRLWVRIVLAITAFLVVPVVVNLVSHLFKMLNYAYKKVSMHDELLANFGSATKRLRNAKDAIILLSTTLEEKHILEIKRVQLYKNTLHVVIRRRQEPKLAEGQSVVIIDRNDGLIMGHFTIVQVRETEYFASENGYIDPVWMGYVRNTGEVEMFPPPGIVGFTVMGD